MEYMEDRNDPAYNRAIKRLYELYILAEEQRISRTISQQPEPVSFCSEFFKKAKHIIF